MTSFTEAGANTSVTITSDYVWPQDFFFFFLNFVIDYISI
jgi:hypothetical protein